VRELQERGDTIGALTVCQARLDASIGRRFPDFDLVGRDGKAVRVHSLIRDSTALAIVPSLDHPVTQKWRSLFELNGWRTPAGRKVYLLVRSDSVRAGTRIVDEHVFLYTRPLPDYLAYALIYPCALLVSQDLVFEGYTGNTAGT
jgi:peroxiredoxin